MRSLDQTRITCEIQLSIPIISAAMDTVTEARLAMAQAGVHVGERQRTCAKAGRPPFSGT